MFEAAPFVGIQRCEIFATLFALEALANSKNSYVAYACHCSSLTRHGFASSKQGRRKSRSKCKKNSKLAVSKVAASNLRMTQDINLALNAGSTPKPPKGYPKHKPSEHDSAPLISRAHTRPVTKHARQCVNVDHTCCCNLLIKDDFMEKVKLGFWSIPQLQRAVESNGVFFKRDGKLEKCRSSFRSVIEVVLSELSFVLPEVVYENSYNNIDQ